jgi:hypothetical protein
LEIEGEKVERERGREIYRALFSTKFWELIGISFYFSLGSTIDPTNKMFPV